MKAAEEAADDGDSFPQNLNFAKDSVEYFVVKMKVQHLLLTFPPKIDTSQCTQSLL